MTTDRAMTADVIAVIDAAMDDWEHAGDVFRYVAPWDEPVVRDPSGPVEWAMADGLDGYAATASARIGQWIAVCFISEWARDYRPRWITVGGQPWPRMPHRHHEHIGRPPWLDPGPGRAQ